MANSVNVIIKRVSHARPQRKTRVTGYPLTHDLLHQNHIGSETPGTGKGPFAQRDRRTFYSRKAPEFLAGNPGAYSIPGIASATSRYSTVKPLKLTGTATALPANQSEKLVMPGTVSTLPDGVTA